MCLSFTEPQSDCVPEAELKESLIRTLEKAIKEKDIEIGKERNRLNSVIKDMEEELTNVRKERDQLKSQLDDMNKRKESMGEALCRQLQRIEQLLQTTTSYVQELK